MNEGAGQAPPLTGWYTLFINTPGRLRGPRTRMERHQRHDSGKRGHADGTRGWTERIAAAKDELRAVVAAPPPKQLPPLFLPYPVRPTRPWHHATPVTPHHPKTHAPP